MNLEHQIDLKKILNIQAVQNQSFLYLNDTVPAGGRRLGSVAISNEGAFLCTHITGTFTTQALVAAVATDTGIDYLRGQLVDGGSGNRPIFNDFIPLHLWMTPGRRKSIAPPAASADSNQMHIIFPLNYIFPINGHILLDVRNDSDVDNAYSLVFCGFRIRSSATNAGM